MFKKENGSKNPGYDILLGMILMVALTYRFCDLGMDSLWGEGLANVYAASQAELKDVFLRVVYNDEQPPGYVLLLRAIWQVAGESDIWMVLPSALASVLSVYLIYWLGAQYLSKSAGLLAASFLAGATYEIYYSQIPGVYTLFSCVVLIHLHVFLKLFLCVEARGEDSGITTPSPQFHTTKIGKFSLGWESALPGDARTIKIFWITGITLLFLHTMGMAVIASEFLLAVFLCKKNRVENAGAKLKQVFIIPLGFFVWWLPAMWEQAGRAMVPGNDPVFAWFGLLRFILGPDMVRTSIAIVGLGVSAVVGLYYWRKKSHTGVVQAWLILAAFCILVLLICAAGQTIFSMPLSKKSLLFLGPPVFLLSAWGVSKIIDNIPYPVLSSVAVAVTVLFLFYVQLDKNRQSGILTTATPDIRTAFDIVKSDNEFMNGPRKFIFSHDIVEYYVKKYGIRYKTNGFIDAWDKTTSGKADAELNPQQFYYLELFDSRDGNNGSPLMQKFRSQYSVICMSSFEQVTLIKFDTRTAPENGVEKHEVFQCPWNAGQLPAATTAETPQITQ